MATTRFYLDLRGRAKDGKGSIVITIYHNNSTSMIPTGIRVAPNEWDGNRVIRAVGSDALNARLGEQKMKIDKSIAILSLSSNFMFMSATQIKNAVTEKKVYNNRVLVSDVFREYTGRDMKEGTREIYKSALKKVQAFGGDNMNMNSIDLKWLYRFEKHLSLTQGVNGRAIYMRCLRAICNYAKHSGIIKNYPFENFHVKHEPTRKRSIPIEKFREFINYPASLANQKYRDYFLLMFFLIGINAKDLLLAKPSAVCNGRFEYIREKTHKKYSVKIEPEAEDLLQKYAGKNWLLSAMDTCKHYKSFAREINEGIQSIGPTKMETIPDPEDLFGESTVQCICTPIIPGITTYFARHSWATYAYEIGIPIDVISQALGHSTGNRTTLIYVKYDREKVDEANRKVIDYLLSG